MTSANYARQPRCARKSRSIEETVAVRPASSSYPPDNPFDQPGNADPEEIWKPVVGYEGRYEVSSYGRVKSVPYVHPNTGNTLRGKTLKTFINRDGYERFRALGKKNIPIHRAVALAFLPNPNGLPLVNHKDGDKLNNRLSNLEWETKSGNSKHAIQTGLIDLNHLRTMNERRNDANRKITADVKAQIIADCETRKENKLSLAKIAKRHGVSVGSVFLIEHRL